jgi:hypothetical protein
VSRRRVADLPHDRQAQLVLNRSLAHIEARRTALVEDDRDWRTRCAGSPGSSIYQNWPLSLPNPRWVVEHVVGRANRRARTFTLTDAVCRELVDAVLVVLALEAA